MMGSLLKLKQNMMEKVKIIDDLLDNNSFQNLNLTLLPSMEDARLPWYFGSITGENIDDLKNHQFTFLFYQGYPEFVIDENYPLVEPILKKIPDFYQPVRIKANLQPHSEEKYSSGWHWDYSFDQKPVKNAFVGIFYLNTNNGYTELDDGTKVDCVANRLLLFPNEMKHRGVSTNDTRFKSVINIVFTKYII